MITLPHGCANFLGNQHNETPLGWEVIQTQNPKTNEALDGKIRIKYENYEKLYNDAIEDIENEMLSSHEAQKKLKLIPKGGYIVIYIFRPTIYGANTKIFASSEKTVGYRRLRKLAKRVKQGDSGGFVCPEAV